MYSNTQVTQASPFRDVFITAIAMMYIAARMLGFSR
jgi:hypothetical protein